MSIFSASTRFWIRVLGLVLLFALPTFACSSATPTASPLEPTVSVPTPGETVNPPEPTPTVPVPAWRPSQADWENIGGGIVGSPVAVSWEPSRLDIFAQGGDGA